jgi:glycolate oxidase iron-sulfur subunit
MRDIGSTGATTVVTANPGCMMQLQRGLERAGIPGEVRHVVELLDEAYTISDSTANQRTNNGQS